MHILKRIADWFLSLHIQPEKPFTLRMYGDSLSDEERLERDMERVFGKRTEPKPAHSLKLHTKHAAQKANIFPDHPTVQ